MKDLRERAEKLNDKWMEGLFNRDQRTASIEAFALQIRNEALEDAADVAESYGNNEDGIVEAAIRALKDPCILAVAGKTEGVENG